MIVYHGSSIEISKPDTLHSRERLDFGIGFYTTPLYEQAERWAKRIKAHLGEGVVSKYSFDEATAAKLSILRFEEFSREWLDFVAMCRKGKDRSKYDIVIGGVADDRVFNTIEIYLDFGIDENEAIRRLRFEEPNMQICFRTENAIQQCLQFEGSEMV